MTLRTRVLIGAYILASVAVALVAVTNSTLLNPVGITALVLTPLAVIGAIVFGFAIGIPWLFGLTDADPDDYSDGWVYPVVIIAALANAVAYLWMAMRYRQRRSAKL
jgi:uncharacterized membrane protein